MNVYGSQIWTLKKNYLNKFYVAWRKAIRRIWKLPYRTHNNLLHLINLCLPIDVTLEKRSIKYIWNLINGENKLYGSIVKLSLYNNSTTLGENIRYFTYKYKIYNYEWYDSINVIFKKIDRYVLSRLDEDVQCDAIAIRELCESRDSCDDLMFDHSELHIFIETLCIHNRSRLVSSFTPLYILGNVITLLFCIYSTVIVYFFVFPVFCILCSCIIVVYMYRQYYSVIRLIIV